MEFVVDEKPPQPEYDYIESDHGFILTTSEIERKTIMKLSIFHNCVTYDYRVAADPYILDLEWVSPEFLHVNLMLGPNRVATLMFMKERIKDPKCRQDIETLKKLGHKAKTSWFVSTVQLDEKLRGKGLGRRLYETAFLEVKRRYGSFYTGLTTCTGHGAISEDALRVWASLMRKYPHSGDVMFVS